MTSFRLQTPSLEIAARMPPGVRQGSLPVVTTGFSMSAEWTPAESGQPLKLKTGDAVSLLVRRSAADVPGMVFSPLPEFRIDGLQAYPEAPRVNDRVDRGEIRGDRTDRVTFICEREGEFTIPALSFQWWDPVAESLQEVTAPALTLDVAPNPALAILDDGGWVPTPGRWPLWAIASVVLGLLIAFRLGGKSFRQLRETRRRKRAILEAGEPWAFEQALSACRSGDASRAYHAINVWLPRYRSLGADWTLLRLADESGQENLVIEVRRLQAALVGGLTEQWCGRMLAEQLVAFRSARARKDYRADSLPPLNPAMQQAARS